MSKEKLHFRITPDKSSEFWNASLFWPIKTNFEKYKIHFCLLLGKWNVMQGFHWFCKCTCDREWSTFRSQSVFSHPGTRSTSMLSCTPSRPTCCVGVVLARVSRRWPRLCVRRAVRAMIPRWRIDRVRAREARWLPAFLPRHAKTVPIDPTRLPPPPLGEL